MTPFSASPRPRWRKSSHSLSNGNCVEVATGSLSVSWCDPGDVLVRDSKDPDGPVLAFSRAGWAAFTSSLKD